MKIDHIGYAVKNIEKALPDFLMLGYSPVNDVITDKDRWVRLLFLKNNENQIELVEPYGEQSPVSNLIKKNGNIPYHICYIVKSIHESLAELKKQKCIIIDSPRKAVAFQGRRVAFLMNASLGLFELVEEQ